MDPRDFQRLAHDTAAALGTGWRADRGPRSNSAYLCHADGRRLWFATNTRTPTQLLVNGEYPKSCYYYRDGEGRETIGVSAARGARAIARDIARRLLPRYELTLSKVSAHLAASYQAAAGRAETASRLGAAYPAARVHVGDVLEGDASVQNSASDPVGWVHADISHDGTTVNLKATSLPADLAVRFFELISGAVDRPAADRVA